MNGYIIEVMNDFCVLGVKMRLSAREGLFSPRAIDAGTLAMLKSADLRPEDVVLDLGCGYGCIGIWAALQIGANNVTMTDILPDAAKAARQNACENGLSGIQITVGDALSAVEGRDFTLILCNPPYNADFSVPKRFIEQGYRHLAEGGRFMMVTKRRLWYENKLRAVFGGVTVREVDGYFVFKAEKRVKSSPNDKKGE